MMQRQMMRVVTMVLVLACAVAGGLSTAQPTASAAAPPSANSEHLGAPQLDQLTAPVALYPDPVLGSILAAATYPLEVVEAARWLDDPAHAQLKGQGLAAALDAQHWDPSVKLLVSLPDVLRMMNNNLDWTEQLGDAFLAQQADLMDSVQRLRQRAATNGSLKSTPQQTVGADEGDVTIEPTSPGTVYVPYYVPDTVYAPWPWADYPPYYFPLPPDLFYAGAFIGFGLGVVISEPWGWYGWNWPGHRFVVYPHGPHAPGMPLRSGEARPWQHDPDHRRGVPYRDSATAVRYLGTNAAAGRPFRGYPPESTPLRAQPEPVRTQPAPTPEPLPRSSAPIAAHPPPPAYESFGRGQQVRSEQARGSSSRSAPAASFHGGGAAPHGGGGHH